MKKFFIKYFTAESPPEGVRANNFNIIRLVGSLLVVLGHMPILMGLTPITFLGVGVHIVGVKILFAVSGYLITVSYLNDENFGRYMIRRSFRLFPALILLICLTVFVAGPVITELSVRQYFSNPDTWKYFSNIILNIRYSLPGCAAHYVHMGAINGSLWTLPVEFGLYLLLPLTVKISKKFNMLTEGTVICMLAFGVLYYLKMRLSGFNLTFYGTDWTEGFTLAFCFYIGSLFSLKQTEKFLNLQLSVILLVICGCIPNKGAIGELIITFVISYFTISFAKAKNPVFSNWFTKCDFTYGIYLYAFPVQQVIFNHMKAYGVNPGITVAFLICTAFTVVLAVFSYYLVEKPAQQLSKNILKKLRKS